MPNIAAQTYAEINNLLTKPHHTNGDALVTESGHVYSSKSITGRFLKLIGSAKPVLMEDLQRHFNDRIESLGLTNTKIKITDIDGGGNRRVNAESLQSFKLKSLVPHDVAMKKRFEETTSMLKNSQQRDHPTNNGIQKNNITLGKTKKPDTYYTI